MLGAGFVSWHLDFGGERGSYSWRCFRTCHRWEKLDVDLVMSRFNFKLPRFVSGYRDPLAEEVYML